MKEKIKTSELISLYASLRKWNCRTYEIGYSNSQLKNLINRVHVVNALECNLENMSLSGVENIDWDYWDENIEAWENEFEIAMKEKTKEKAFMEFTTGIIWKIIMTVDNKDIKEKFLYIYKSVVEYYAFGEDS